jgi:predicted nuclease of restriction endonuclease-like (RecB) superfamily
VTVLALSARRSEAQLRNSLLRNWSMARCRLLPSLWHRSSERFEFDGVRVREPNGGAGSEQHRRRRSLLGPAVGVGVQLVVDPCEGAVADERVSRGKKGEVAPAAYAQVLDQLKVAVRSARMKAHRAVNTELIGLYWTIGRTLGERRRDEGWGSKVVERLAADLRAEFPDMTGLSSRSLVYMQTMASVWPDAITQQPVARLPWGHITVLLDRLDDTPTRDWYAKRAVANGWSRAVLLNQIKSHLHERIGAAPTNFVDVLGDSELDAQLVKDPYNFEFLGLTERVEERVFEQRLMDRIQEFLLELGEGWSLYARQRRFMVGTKEFIADLIFFHVEYRRFVVCELKVDEFDPAHLGQLGFYVEWAERHLRKPEHQPTVGILLVASKEEVVVRYALAASTAPLAVATYTFERLPAKTRKQMKATRNLPAAVADNDR